MSFADFVLALMATSCSVTQNTSTYSMCDLRSAHENVVAPRASRMNSQFVCRKAKLESPPPSPVNRHSWILYGRQTANRAGVHFRPRKLCRRCTYINSSRETRAKPFGGTWPDKTVCNATSKRAQRQGDVRCHLQKAYARLHLLCRPSPDDQLSPKLQNDARHPSYNTVCTLYHTEHTNALAYNHLDVLR